MRLAEILLMKPFERRLSARRLPVNPVIALHQQVIHAVDGSGLDGSRRQPGRRGQLHAQRFVEDDALEALDRGLQDMRARRAAEGQGDFAAFDAHGDFVLRAGERKPDPFLARQKRTLREFPEYRRRVPLGESLR